MATDLLAAQALKTLYTNNFDHTNVSGLTADPAIRTRGDAEGASHPTNGEIIIEDQDLIEFGLPKSSGYRNRTYDVEITVQIDNQTDTTKIGQILDELDRIHGANNASSSRTYECDMAFNFDTNFLSSYATGIIRIIYLPEVIPV